jgi:hypothetical protein
MRRVGNPTLLFFYAPNFICNIRYCNQCGDYIPDMLLFAAAKDKIEKSTIRCRRRAAKG